jgi:excisionase family DNA binding protein
MDMSTTAAADALRAVAKALGCLADALEAGPAPMADLVPLDALPVSVRAARRMIASGRLPATKQGRRYLVSRADVARVFAPTTRAPKPSRPRRRESDSARVTRQLESAGILAH